MAGFTAPKLLWVQRHEPETFAATAMVHALPLLTANAKHFSAISGLKLQVFKP